MTEAKSHLAGPDIRLENLKCETAMLEQLNKSLELIRSRVSPQATVAGERSVPGEAECSVLYRIAALLAPPVLVLSTDEDGIWKCKTCGKRVDRISYKKQCEDCEGTIRGGA